MRIFKCTKCDNMITYLKKSACDVRCCGEAMVEIEPNTSDGAGEKHVPVISVEGNKVTVSISEVEHPMTEAHYINWIAIETDNGRQRKELTPEDKPVATFYIEEGDNVKAAYEYCNLHGFWKN